MLRSLAVSVLAAVLLIAAPARADDVRAAIDAANDKMMADYAAGDAKALALAYTEDAVMLPPMPRGLSAMPRSRLSGRAGSMEG